MKRKFKLKNIDNFGIMYAIKEKKLILIKK